MHGGATEHDEMGREPARAKAAKHAGGSAADDIQQKLVVVEQPPEVWYNQQGGKQKYFAVHVRAEGIDWAAVRDAADPAGSGLVSDGQAVSLPLRITLCYESREKVAKQEIFQLRDEPKISSKTCTGLVECRINEVSRNHQKQKFRILIEARGNGLTAPLQVFTTSINVLSKYFRRKYDPARESWTPRASQPAVTTKRAGQEDDSASVEVNKRLKSSDDGLGGKSVPVSGADSASGEDDRVSDLCHRAIAILRRNQWIHVGVDQFGAPLRVCPECRALDGAGVGGQHTEACPLRDVLDAADQVLGGQSSSGSSGSCRNGSAGPKLETKRSPVLLSGIGVAAPVVGAAPGPGIGMYSSLATPTHVMGGPLQYLVTPSSNMAVTHAPALCGTAVSTGVSPGSLGLHAPRAVPVPATASAPAAISCPPTLTMTYSAFPSRVLTPSGAMVGNTNTSPYMPAGPCHAGSARSAGLVAPSGVSSALGAGASATSVGCSSTTHDVLRGAAVSVTDGPPLTLRSVPHTVLCSSSGGGGGGGDAAPSVGAFSPGPGGGPHTPMANDPSGPLCAPSASLYSVQASAASAGFKVQQPGFNEQVVATGMLALHEAAHSLDAPRPESCAADACAPPHSTFSLARQTSKSAEVHAGQA